MRRMTFGERENLAIRLWFCFGAFMFLALIFGVVAGAMKEATTPLVLVVLCVVIGGAFASLSLWVRYHENKPRVLRQTGRR